VLWWIAAGIFWSTLMFLLNKSDWIRSRCCAMSPLHSTAYHRNVYYIFHNCHDDCHEEFTNALSVRVTLLPLVCYDKFISDSDHTTTHDHTSQHHPQWTRHVELSVPECLEWSANVQEAVGGWNCLSFLIIPYMIDRRSQHMFVKLD